MASRPNSSNKDRPDFADLDARFSDFRDKMNRNREAFFNEAPTPPTAGSSGPSSFFGRESPFFSRVSYLDMPNIALTPTHKPCLV